MHHRRVNFLLPTLFILLACNATPPTTSPTTSAPVHAKPSAAAHVETPSTPSLPSAGSAKDEPEPPKKQGPLLDQPNVLFITIDTLRADRLGAYGYPIETSPKLDALAARSVVFKQARAQGCMTRYSVPSLVTGRYVTEIERTAWGWTKVHDSNLLFAEVFHEAGYYTAAFHSIDYFMPHYGMSQGFETYDTSTIRDSQPVFAKTTSPKITDRVLEHFDTHIKNEKRPWLVWAYYSDPHHSYLRHPGTPLPYGRTASSRYDHEIRFTDTHVGRLLDELDTRKMLDNTIVLITSDHGEALDAAKDHSLFHGQTLYDSEIRVPLIIHVPSSEVTPRAVDVPVGNIDLFPTLLELAGLHVSEERELQGVSLVPWLKGLNPDRPPVFSEKAPAPGRGHGPQKAMIRWPHKLIWHVGSKRYEVYNLEEDPGENHNLVKTQPEVFEDLNATFQAWLTDDLKEIKAGTRRPAP